MATFRIDQATPGAGSAGRSRHDLVPNEVITLVATAPTGPGITYTWELLDKVGSSATLSSTTGPSVTIGPNTSIVRPCAFLIKLTVNDNGNITETVRIASVRSTNLGLRVPLFPETAPTTNRLGANDPDLSTDNAIYTDRAGLGAAGQNWRGWAEWAYELIMAAETIAGGGATGPASGDLSGTYPGPTVAKIRGRTVVATAPTNGQVYAWNSGLSQWEPTTPATTPSGTAGGDLSGSYPNPGVDAIQGVAISPTAPTNGQILTYNSGTLQWEPATTTALVDADFPVPPSGAVAPVDRLVRTAVSTYATIKDNLYAGVSPTGSDNASAGYEAGSIWVKQSLDPTNHVFIAAGEDAGSMIWLEVGASSNNVIIFQPGGTAVDNVYTTFATFYAAGAAIRAAGGTVLAYIDDSLSPAQAPSGSYNFDKWRFFGMRVGSQTTLTFLNGATWSVSFFGSVSFELTDVSFNLDSGALSSFMSFVAGGAITVVLRNSTIAGLSGYPFIDGSAPGAGNQCSVRIYAYGASYLGTNALKLDDTPGGSGSNGFLYLYDSSTLGGFDSVTGPSGYLEMHQESRRATVRAQTLLLAGTQLYQGQATPHNWPINESQLGTVELHVGSIYLYSNSVLRSISKAMLGGAVVADTGILKLRRFTGGTLIATWTAAGTLQDTPLGGSDIIIGNDDWYDLYLVAGGAAQTAVLKGVRLFVHEPGTVS